MAHNTVGTFATFDAVLGPTTQAIPSVDASEHTTLPKLDKDTRGKILALSYPRLFTISNRSQPLITAKQ